LKRIKLGILEEGNPRSVSRSVVDHSQLGDLWHHLRAEINRTIHPPAATAWHKYLHVLACPCPPDNSFALLRE